MLRDGIKIWLRNPSVAVPFLIHNFVRYGILLTLILYIMIKTGSFSILEIPEHLSVGVVAIAVITDLLVEGYFISAEIRACYDAIEGVLNLDRAFKLALKTLPQCSP